MIKAVKRYQSSDGQLHENIEDARKHDALQRRMSAVKTILMNPRMGSSVSMMSLELTNNPEIAKQMRDALNGVLDYHRNYGKLRKA